MDFKPDFLGVGAAKAATTTLRDILVQHPQIYLPDAKEIHFFDMDENYRRGKEWYWKTAFSQRQDEKICGEFSPSYMYFDHVPRRILESYGPDIKFIFILRNPVDRAYSHHRMHYLRGVEEKDFLQAIEAEPRRLRLGSQNDQRRYSYISRGQYSKQVKNFLNFFPRQQMYFLLFEEFVRMRATAVDDILRFLGVDVIPLTTTLQSNPANKPKSKIIASVVFKQARWKEFAKPLLPEGWRRKAKQKLKLLNQGAAETGELEAKIRKELFLKYYAADITELEDLTGLDLAPWRYPPQL